MGFLISVGFGLLGAAITNYLLRDRLGAAWILLAILAGVVAGAIANTILVLLLYWMIGSDLSLYAIIGTIAGPVFTALAAWRWRPKSRPAGDLRN